MTKVRWTAKAADDLADIVNYINQDNPDVARRVAQTIFNRVSELRTSKSRRIVPFTTLANVSSLRGPTLGCTKLPRTRSRYSAFATLRVTGRRRSRASLFPANVS